MPFGRFQFLLFWVFQLLILLWQWPMWPPLALAFFAVVALGVWKTLPEQPVWPGLVAVAVVAGGALVSLPHTREHALFGLFLVTGWIFLWRRQNVTDYLLVFILGISQTFLLLLVRPDALSRGLMLSPLFFPVFVATVFFLVLRHDMETHYIVKHRLGRQSRRVEVGRLLQSRRVLDAPMLGLILGTGLGITALSLVAGWAVAPALGWVRLRPAVPSDFPPVLDVARLGRPVVTGRAQLTVRGEPGAVERAVYWRGQVHDRLDGGVWRRAPVKGGVPGGEASDSPDCAWLEVTLENAALADGYAPLFPRATRPGTAARLTTDHRVRLTGGQRTYGVCVARSPAQDPEPPPLAAVPLTETLAAWADRVVSSGAGFEANVAAVLRFLEGYRYDDAYPRPPPGRDPLVHFLAHEKAGPCGLFASVTVVFLTRAGIPARLITGFSHGTRTRDGRRFSDGDAHSWVEAWHPTRGWVTLDPTRSARLALRARRSRDPARLALGWIALGSVPSFALLFWAGLFLARRRAARSVPVRSAPAPARKISQTTLEAQLLFQELVSGPEFRASPRQPGEAALAYARRLEGAGHSRAGEVREAAELAGRILFSRVSVEEKITLLDRLRLRCRGQA